MGFKRRLTLAPLFGNRKGQSLAELAIFAVVLLSVMSFLLSYGMSANYQQRIGMQAFRKAQARAKTVDPTNAILPLDMLTGRFRWKAFLQSLPSYMSDLPFYSNGLAVPASNNYKYANYTIIEDKPMPTASGLFPVGKRTPIMASEDAVCSIDLYSSSKIDPFNLDLWEVLYTIFDLRNRPRADFEINGEQYQFITNELSFLPDLPDIINSFIPQGGNLMFFIMPEIGAIIDLLVPSIIYAGNDDEIDGLQGYTIKEANNSSLKRSEGAGITATDNIDVTDTITHRIKFRLAGEHTIEQELHRDETRTWSTANE